MIEFSKVPVEKRPVIQCLDIPTSSYATMAAEMDSISVADHFRAEIETDFLNGKLVHSLAGWATANTSHSHSPTHIDAAGSATVSRIVNVEGRKIWLLNVEDERQAVKNMDVNKYVGRDIARISKYDAIMLECGDEM